MSDKRTNFLKVVPGGFRPWRRKGGSMAEVLSNLARIYDDQETYYVVTHEGNLKGKRGSVSTFQKCVLKGIFDFYPDEGAKENIILKWRVPLGSKRTNTEA